MANGMYLKLFVLDEHYRVSES